MKKYRICSNFYVINVLILIVSSIAVFLSFHYMLNTILKILYNRIFIIAYGLIGLPFSYSIVLNGQLIQQTIGRKKIIKLNEVEYIVEQPNSNLAKIAIGVFGGASRINITSWTKEYEELIKIIIERCSKNPGIKIDPKVLKIIEGS